jgi:hypothetical protein
LRAALGWVSVRSMERAAIGFRVHSGWAACVAVSLADGAPVVIERSRIQLVKTFNYTFRQPYHTGARMGLPRAAAFISQVQRDAERLAAEDLRATRAKLRKRGFALVRCGILFASGRPLPELALILASHALIHTADGELFRNALVRACARCRMPVVKMKEREIVARAAVVLEIDAAKLQRSLIDMGKGIGPPWSQDEKLAALVAWIGLLPTTAGGASPAPTRKNEGTLRSRG